MTSRAAVDAALVEGVDGLADLVAFGREDLFTKRLDGGSDLQRMQRRQLSHARALAAALTALLVGLAATSVLAIAILLVGDGAVDGVLLAVMPLVAIATFEAIGPLSAAYEHLDRSCAASRRLVELVDAPEQACDPTTPTPLPIAPGRPMSLEVRDLTFGYGDELVLRGAELRVPARLDGGDRRTERVREVHAGQQFGRASGTTTWARSASATQSCVTSPRPMPVERSPSWPSATTSSTRPCGTTSPWATTTPTTLACGPPAPPPGSSPTIRALPDALDTRAGEDGSR